jgi:hypothetical protein
MKQRSVEERREAFAKGEAWEPGTAPAPALCECIPAFTEGCPVHGLRRPKAPETLDWKKLGDLVAAGMTSLKPPSDPTNPKDMIGVTKVSISAIPPTALLHEAQALMDGEKKYGTRNWRTAPVQARIYLDACFRHLYAWMEGEEYAEDSGVHHLGHARACLAILIDAAETGNLVDNRPKSEAGQKAFTHQLKATQKELEARR